MPKEREERAPHITSSQSGWTNNELGLAWLRDVFHPLTQAKAGRSKRLLFVDGHGSHISIEFLEFAISHRIPVVVLPPHSTHTLQPLDVGMFSPLAKAYSKGLDHLMFKYQASVLLHKGDFYSLFRTAWDVSFIESNILSSFRATGLSLWQPAHRTPIF